MSTIVHVREGGGHCSVHVDKILKKKLATKVNIYLKNLFLYWQIASFLGPIESFYSGLQKNWTFWQITM